GGNPFPISLSPSIPFPRFGTYVTVPKDLHMPYINQWNLSLQRQVGANWLFAANYLGSNVIHNLINSEGNPAVFLGTGACAINGVNYSTCSAVSNTQQRRARYRPGVDGNGGPARRPRSRRSIHVRQIFFPVSQPVGFRAAGVRNVWKPWQEHDSRARPDPARYGTDACVSRARGPQCGV